MSEQVVRTVTETDIPIIDIGALRDGTNVEFVGKQLGRAATEVGFLYVRNHGVERGIIDTARAAGLAFFNLPDEVKLTAAVNKHHHGYLKPGATKMYDGAEVDLKESFNWGMEFNAPQETLSAKAFLGPNPWPAPMPELRAGVYPYYEAASACAVDLLKGFATAAGLPSDTFTRASNYPISRGSLQYYPPQPLAAGKLRYGVAPHTDFGVLTVLCQDEVGGLQLQTLDDEWIAVPPVPGTLVVNIGDLLQRWSNGLFRSTRHRVINASGRERLSLVLAYDPNFETLVDPSIFCRPGEVPKDEAITCGDYLTWRFKKAFAYRQ